MNQKQVWNNIANEWNKFRNVPIKEVSNFLKGKKGRILDLGSGSGRHLTKIRNGKMYLIDFSKEMIKLAKKKAKEEKIDAKFFITSFKKLPFKENFFDSAIAISTIHCIKGKRNRKKVAEELFRIMKGGVKALILVWNKNSKRFKNSPKEKYVKWKDRGKRYYYLFTPQEIYDLFKKSGFEIVSKEVPKENIIFIIQKPISE